MIKETRYLLISNITKETSTEELEKYFSKFGVIQNVNTLKPDGSSWAVIIAYIDIIAATKAMNEGPHRINGNRVDVQYNPTASLTNTTLKQSTSQSSGGIGPSTVGAKGNLSEYRNSDQTLKGSDSEVKGDSARKRSDNAGDNNTNHDVTPPPDGPFSENINKKGGVELTVGTATTSSNDKSASSEPRAQVDKCGGHPSSTGRGTRSPNRSHIRRSPPPPSTQSRLPRSPTHPHSSHSPVVFKSKPPPPSRGADPPLRRRSRSASSSKRSHASITRGGYKNSRSRSRSKPRSGSLVNDRRGPVPGKRLGGGRGGGGGHPINYCSVLVKGLPSRTLG